MSSQAVALESRQRFSCRSVRRLWAQLLEKKNIMETCWFCDHSTQMERCPDIVSGKPGNNAVSVTLSGDRYLDVWGFEAWHIGDEDVGFRSLLHIHSSVVHGLGVTGVLLSRRVQCPLELIWETEKLEQWMIHLIPKTWSVTVVAQDQLPDYWFLLSLLLNCNIKWKKTLDNLATNLFIHHRGVRKETNWVNTKPNCRYMWEILTMHHSVHYTKIAKFKAIK